MTSSAKASFIVAFADELRRAREYNGVSLDHVIERTRLAPLFVEAIENGRWESIPAPYLRGYLSLYARASGMNVEKVLQGFDELMKARANDEMAMLDSSSPLLKQPERVGVTRAKIRTSWFTALTNNRMAAYAALALSLSVFVGSLYVSRRAQRTQTVPISFHETLEVYRQSVHGPRTRITLTAPIPPLSVATESPYSCTVVASDHAFFRAEGDPGVICHLHLNPFDTLVINYNYSSYIAFSPPSALTVLGENGDTVAPYLIGADTAYAILKGKPAHSEATIPDSLVHP